jgi:ABC-type amino acid transport substrate-binding protein
MRASTAAALGAVLAAAGAQAADLAAVKQRGVLRVLHVPVAGSTEFFAAAADGTGVGFDREVLEGFAGLHRLRLEPVALDGWAKLAPALVRGEVVPTRNVVVTRKPAPALHDLEALKATRVGTIAGSSMEEAIRTAGIAAARVDSSIPPGGLPAALARGQVDAVVMGVEDAIAHQRADPALQLGMFLGPPGSLAYGVRKQDVELLAALTEYVDNLRRTPSWNRLVVKYFGEAAPEILRRARAE